MSDEFEFSDFPELNKPSANYEYKGPSPEDFMYSELPGDEQKETEDKRVVLENALLELGYPAKVINVFFGPSFIRYELKCPKGIKAEKIFSMEYDLEHALHVVYCMVYPPDPETETVCLEVPKMHDSIVSVREFYEEPEFRKECQPLLIPMGYNIYYQKVFADIAKTGNMLLAGVTRTGKSVFINNIILSLVLKNSPEDLRLLLIDPKFVEFQAYNGIPHMITENALSYDAANEVNVPLRGLEWIMRESLRRYELFREVHNINPEFIIRNINDYNACCKVKNKEWQKLPYIVVIIEDLQGLLSYDRKNAIDLINRITCRAASCGIHMIISTQRSDRENLDPKIKANIAGRVAFHVLRDKDSYAILDEKGAEKMWSKGEVFYKDHSGTQHLQLPFTGYDIITKITENLKKNNKCIFDKKAEKYIYLRKTSEESGDNGKTSEGTFVKTEKCSDIEQYYPRVMRMFILLDRVSTARIQTEFGLGYSKALQIVKGCEENGWISAIDEHRQRKVLMSRDMFEKTFKRPFYEE